MNKMKKYKNYIYFNITLLVLSIYVIFFPLISIPIKNVFPSFGICPYLAMTGKPCPLCGGTRYFANIAQIFSDWTYILNPFGVLALFLIFELFFRIFAIIYVRKNIKANKLEKNKKIVIIDFTILSLALICFIVYEIIFFVIN